MKDITLYPTETLYALGVNAHDPEALTVLYELKG
ncbi:MAG: tRNA A37 threonylcarbamoyladenosine synthetase subunit TsaC/SUA5/YrdC, partial [Candidatus Azotimanducaceae bacterium]